MRWKTLLFLPILMLLSICFINWGYTQSNEGNDDIYCLNLSDTQEVAKCLQDRTILRQLNEVKDQRINNLEKENALLKQESDLKDKVIAINEKEIAATRRALQDMQTVTDRALKLAEIGKPKSNWQLGGILAGLVVLAGCLIAK